MSAGAQIDWSQYEQKPQIDFSKYAASASPTVAVGQTPQTPAGTQVNLTTGEGAEAAALRQAQVVMGAPGIQMHGEPSLMGRPPASLAQEESFENARTAPAPIPRTVGQIFGGEKPQVPAGMENAAHTAEMIPTLAQSMAPFAGNTIPEATQALAKLFSTTPDKIQDWQKINDAIGAKPSNVILPKSAGDIEDAVTMPGRGLEKIGLDAAKLSKMSPLERMQATVPEWQKAGAAIDSAVTAQTQAGKTLDAGESAYEILKKIPNPQLQQKAIDSFNGLASEVGIVNQREATPSETLALRRALSAGARFGPNGDLNSLGGIRAQLRSAVSSRSKRLRSRS